MLSMFTQNRSYLYKQYIVVTCFVLTISALVYCYWGTLRNGAHVITLEKKVQWG